MSVKPVMICTWSFGVAACRKGWDLLINGVNALNAVEAAAHVTEDDPSVSSVGYGGLPNADGIVELDAAIMDGTNHSAGAVACLTGIRHPISVARRIMETTPHVMLVGENARQYALSHGFEHEELLTPASRAKWERWQLERSHPLVAHFDRGHDTIGLCALDQNGDIAVGCTTSGIAWKLPGRVGDSPIIGSGLYVDNEVGGAAGTGCGDEMMKTCLSYRVVNLMEQGRMPQEACEEALRYLLRKRSPENHGYYDAALIALRRDGLYGAASTVSGFRTPDRLWQWAVATPDTHGVILNAGPYVTVDSTLSTIA